MPHSHISHTPHEAGPDSPARGVDAVGAVVLTLAGPLLLWAGGVLLASDAATAEAALLRTLGLLASGAGMLLLAWWCLGAVGLALMALGRGLHRDAWVRAGARLAPGVLRRTGAAVLGLQLVAAPAAWAQSAPVAASPPSAVSAAPVDASWAAPAASSRAASPTPPADSAAPAVSTVPEAAWTPTSPAPTPPGATARPRSPLGRETVTVRDGDCLWDIAAAELGPDATPREIDRRWRDWHRENRAVIGEDPNLLHTGTVLVAPVFSPHAPPEEAAAR